MERIVTVAAALAACAVFAAGQGEAHAIPHIDCEAAAAFFPQHCADPFAGIRPLILTFEFDESWEAVKLSPSGDFRIDWGDGTVQSGGSPRHTYTYPGTFTVTVYGNLDSFRVYEPATLEQWGDSQWKTTAGMFDGSGVSFRATDSPNMTGVVSTAYMFRGTSFNGDVSSWDVSNVEDMSGMFSGVRSFNGDVSGWDVSSVTDMSGVFGGTSFNGDVSSWDVSSVTDMSGMFGGTSANHPLDGWDVSSVTDMSGMFADSTFNQPLDGWDFSSVTDMSWMFADSTFNQPPNGWNTSSVTDMSGMFTRSTFNQPLDSLDVSGVTNMWRMFHDARQFNQDISSWNTSSVTNMGEMFSGASSFNQPLDAWDVSGVSEPPDDWEFVNIGTGGMSGMFRDAVSFNQPLGSWNTSSVTNMQEMFAGASSFNQPINGWDVSSVTNMQEIFKGASSFDQPLDGWDVSGLVSWYGMFDGADSFYQNLGSWYISLDDLTVTDSNLVVGKISTLLPSDVASTITYRVTHPTGGPFSVDPGTPWLLPDGTPYVDPNGNSPMVGIALVLDPDHGLEPGTYNVTIMVDNLVDGFPYYTNTVQVTYEGLVPKPKYVEPVVVPNRQPLAYASPILLVPAGQVMLNGTLSWDQDGDPLTYKWRQTAGANVTLVGDASPTPTFDAPGSDRTQTFTFELVVNDGSVDSEPFSTTVLVVPDTG